MLSVDNKCDIQYDHLKIFTDDTIPEMIESFMDHVKKSLANPERNNKEIPVKYAAMMSLPCPIYEPSGLYELCNMAEQHFHNVIPLIKEAITEYSNSRKNEFISENEEILHESLIEQFRKSPWIFADFHICAVSSMSWTYTFYINVYDLTQYGKSFKVLNAEYDDKEIANVEYLKNLYIYFFNGLIEKLKYK